MLPSLLHPLREALLQLPSAYPSDPLTQNMLEFFQNGKGIPVVFQGAPDGEDYTMNVFGAKVQGVLSGELSWDKVFEESASEWEQRASDR